MRQNPIESNKNLETVRLRSHPTAESLACWVNQNLQIVDSIQFSWFEPSSDEEYKLVVEKPEDNNKELYWTLLTQTAKSVRKCWQKETNDTALVAGKVAEAISFAREDASSKAQARGTLTNLEVYEDKVKKFPSSSSYDQLDSPFFNSSNSAQEDLEQSYDSLPYEELRKELAKRRESLTGNISQVGITNFVQSVKSGKLSGRLKVQKQESFTNIFFIDGEPVHAEGNRGVGEDSFLQTLGWTTGKFEFEPKLKTSESSITTPLSKLLIMGAKLQDSTRFLKQLGINMDSLLRCKRKQLSTVELEKILAREKSTNPELEASIYKTVSSSVRSVREIVEEFWLERSIWVPALASLFKADLLEIFERHSGTTITAKVIEPSLIEGTADRLTNGETGLIAYSPFLYLVDLQFKHAIGLHLSVILIGFLSTKSHTKSSAISSNGFSMLAQEIKAIPEFTGLLGHYESEIGVALFNSSYNELRKTAQLILDALPPSTLELATSSADTIQLSMGCAHYPDDSKDLESLFGAAEYALDSALKSGGGIIFARDL